MFSKTDLTYWLQEHQQKLYWVLTIAFIPFSFLCFYVSKKTGSSWQDYLQAYYNYQKWSENPAVEKEEFNKLVSLTKSHPALHEKYGSLIAEKCIALNQAALAGSFTEASLNQIKTQIPFHHLFSKTSILIADGKYEAALGEALTLKNKIETENVTKQYSVLFLFNLVRIASLERCLNQHQEEVKALESIRTWLRSECCTPEAKLALSNAFSESKLSFLDYIEHRLGSI